MAENRFLRTDLPGNQSAHKFSDCRHDNKDRREGDGEGLPEGAEPFENEAVDETEVDKGDDEGHEKRHEHRHQKCEEQGFETFGDHGFPFKGRVGVSAAAAETKIRAGA